MDVKTQLITMALMLVGWGIHALLKTYEEDKKVPESISPLDVYWYGPERWKTCGTILLIVVGAMVIPKSLLEKIISFDYEGTTLGWLVFLGIGYNIDSLGKKFFSLFKGKPEE